MYLCWSPSHPPSPPSPPQVRTLFSEAAQYIVLAYALQPSKDIYRKSLGVVRRVSRRAGCAALTQHPGIHSLTPTPPLALHAPLQLLPLPFLRAGYLTCVIPTSRGTPDEAWRQDW